MRYKRTGECNQCGECCGYPRSTDGGQNNPWAADIIQSVESWDVEVIESEMPILRLIGVLVKKGKTYGYVTINNKRHYWIYIPGKGICTDRTPHGFPDSYDQRCPFLESIKKDGTVPCALYNTKEKLVWDKLCQPVPPNVFENEEQLKLWNKNCPSCSYRYE